MDEGLLCNVDVDKTTSSPVQLFLVLTKAGWDFLLLKPCAPVLSLNCGDFG